MMKYLISLLIVLIFFAACDREQADIHSIVESADNSYFIGEVFRPGRPEISFVMDYRKFFEDNTVYNHDIALASAVISATQLRPAFFETLGLSDIITISVGQEDTDRTQVLMGRRTVLHNGHFREIIKVYFRNNNGSFEEMFSDLDIGADTERYFHITDSKHSEWNNRYNFKGLDVTANRAIRAIEEYMENTDVSGPSILWISGFSRGAGIANIVGSYFENSPRVIPFTYTFASPNTTTAYNAGQFETIFNIINLDDMSTHIPPAAWGFTRFGTDLYVSVTSEGQEAYRELTGIIYTYHENPDIAINSLLGLAPTREALYEINHNFFVISENFENKAAATAYIERLRENLRREFHGLIEFYIYETDEDMYRVIIYQTPAFFVHSLPETLMRPGRLPINLANQFLWPQFFLASAYIESVGGPPHQPITYYLIVYSGLT